jgi:hypothetical protein
MDPNKWTKGECYAPVLSQIELRLPVSLAVRLKRKIKSGDVSQAFCQGTLPPNEKYVMRPPAGCKISTPNTYYLLKKTLYGLKRSPRHWYHTAKCLLSKIGLHTLPNSKCTFYGTPIPGQPPLYLGLYVDNFVYFSESDEVKRYFKDAFGNKTTVDFMGETTHFLGIKIQQLQTPTTLTIHLSQPAFTEQLIAGSELNPDCNPTLTPYRSSLPVDAVPTVNLPPKEKQQLISKMCSIIGSLI